MPNIENSHGLYLIEILNNLPLLECSTFKLGQSLCDLWNMNVKYSINNTDFPILEPPISYISLKYQWHTNFIQAGSIHRVIHCGKVAGKHILHKKQEGFCLVVGDKNQKTQN